MHLGFGAASAVIAAPSSPDGPADALRCAQDLVAGDRSRGVGFPPSLRSHRKTGVRSSLSSLTVLARRSVPCFWSRMCCPPSQAREELLERLDGRP